MEQLSICGVEPKPETVAKHRKAKLATRGEYYGIKAGALARDAKVKLDKMRVKLEKLQQPWLEVDPMIEQAMTRTLEAFDELAKQFADSADYMNEVMED